MQPGDLADRTRRQHIPPSNRSPMPLPRKSIAAIALASFAALAGCSSDHKPDEYHRMRPEVSQISTRDRGLQSREVVPPSEQPAAEILSLPQVNEPSRRMTVVFTNLEDLTRRRQF